MSDMGIEELRKRLAQLNQDIDDMDDKRGNLSYTDQGLAKYNDLRADLAEARHALLLALLEKKVDDLRNGVWRRSETDAGVFNQADWTADELEAIIKEVAG
jgi:hypothetical protein